MHIPNIVMKIYFSDITGSHTGGFHNFEHNELRDTIQEYITERYHLENCEFIWQNYPMSIIFSDAIVSFSLKFDTMKTFNAYKVKNFKSYSELCHSANIGQYNETRYREN